MNSIDDPPPTVNPTPAWKEFDSSRMEPSINKAPLKKIQSTVEM